MLAYDIRGSGSRSVFLLHGFLGSGRNLASLARRLSDAHPNVRWILPDLTGHGESPPLPPQPDLSGVARDVLVLADFLHVPRPLTLFGHSMGGRVALAARLLEPSAVGTLALLDISPGPAVRLGGDLQHVLDRLLVAPATSESREQMRDFFIQDGISGPLTDWLLMNLLHEGGYLRWRIDRSALARLHQASLHADLWPALAGPGLRAFCIRGGRSDFVSEADAARMAALGCSVHTLADAGHFLHVDQQQALLALLGDCMA